MDDIVSTAQVVGGDTPVVPVVLSAQIRDGDAESDWKLILGVSIDPVFGWLVESIGILLPVVDGEWGCSDDAVQDCLPTAQQLSESSGWQTDFWRDWGFWFVGLDCCNYCTLTVTDVNV